MKTFKDYPEFTPNVTPKQMLQLGVFGGTYFRPIYSSVTRKSYRNQHLEFPKSWFSGVVINSNTCDKSKNYFNEISGTSLEYWESKGWIHPQDPYGWFQWYCRFYRGRRTSDDKRQIDRWLKIAGKKGRFRTRKNKSNKIKQLLLQWGVKV